MRRFYLFPGKSGNYFAQIMDLNTGTVVVTRSTRTTNRDEAAIIAGEWLKNGFPVARVQAYRRTVEATGGLKNILQSIEKTSDLDPAAALQIADALRRRGLISFPVVKPGKGNRDFIEYLKEFWDWEKSPYIREKLNRGYKIGKRHALESGNRIARNWEPFFRGRTLDTITREDIKKFSLWLGETKNDKGEKYSANYLNAILIAGFTPLKWAAAEKIIPADPTDGLLRFSGTIKKRGVLTPQEAGELFSMPWKDERVRIANRLAATTGLRLGEVLALRESDLEPVKPILYVRHSWSIDGLKAPKTNEERRAILLPEIRAELLALLKDNPHQGGDRFIFYSARPDTPLSENMLVRGLHEAIEKLNENLKAENREQEKIDQKGRNIVFHSWRHYYSARMLDEAEAEEIMRTTGHKTKAVFDDYADHIEAENLEKMGKVAAKVFANIVKFERKGA
ncbi:tyrosine-type recombinase/integrase [Treponema primitia]|uniref:tyrosine-type recombinase/integrase n=1 Tax=Treponema primitia TaxID=88058 RepID=UPI0002554BFD|nr:site-specific integrase [Treponema primitia]